MGAGEGRGGGRYTGKKCRLVSMFSLTVVFFLVEIIVGKRRLLTSYGHGQAAASSVSQNESQKIMLNPTLGSLMFNELCC